MALNELIYYILIAVINNGDEIFVKDLFNYS
jgi:hypothetical protein